MMEQPFEIKKAVITGATGMIGVTLANYLLHKGVEVLVIIREHSPRRHQLPTHKNLTIIECNIDNYKDLTNKIEGTYDAMYHLAWAGTFGDSRNDTAIQTKNIEYTLDAVNLAEKLKCRVFLFAGSQAEYGRVEEKLNGSVKTFPENGYGVAKLCAGSLSRISCEQKKIRHIWTRILSIYGPYDGKNTMVMSTIYKLLNNQVPQLTKGEQQWDYLYSKDAVRALYLASVKGIHGKIYCIGSGNTRFLYEYMKCIQNAVDNNGQIAIGAVEYREKQVMYLCADITELTKDTGFVPEISFEEGIKETVEWCRSNNP